ncbi:hypothetical protein P280DRAFT_105984 [Massarina eburnea CBS 473.64]|uniref:Zn(2)-C6 fungal-type domain-containing protein n=1 Tax=Massarina eburnea CBS 473.64 TaxID=1395130 RepID=A0A6A6RTC3_9PLEO|nr:hypothetical protein P280DRAFT_105984 [Massarina eburnea CBS 473.64]
MSGYYPSNPNIPPQYYNVNPNAVPNANIPNVPPMMAPDGSYAHNVPESPIYHTMPGPFVSYPDQHLQQPYMGPYEDVPNGIDPAQGGNARVRRRPGPGDQVKHRRTRSGCYTCRQRRVKCDETHPVCERCRKGTRECIYPDAQSSQKGGKSGSKTGKSSSGEGSSSEDVHEDGNDRLPPILDDDEEDSGMETDPKDGQIAYSTPALTLDQSPTPSTEASQTTPVSASRPQLPRKGSQSNVKSSSARPISSLPKDVQFYLNYFLNNMTHHHYALKRNTGDFLKTEFLNYALKYEPLLYAVVGYAAYFHTLSQPDGRISTFLKYYNESVTRLLNSIQKSKKQGLATFLTVLQLAAIEEVLGDWVNLMGHQKAAYEMLIRLYTPKTIAQSDFHLKVLLWYVRFDLFVGFQSGGEATLSQEWYVAVHEHYVQRSHEAPDDLNLKYEERFAYSRLVAKHVHDFFLRKGRGQMSDEAFTQGRPHLEKMVNDLDKNISPALLCPSKRVKGFQGTPDPDDIVNPYEPDVLWDEPYWTSNYLILDMYGIIFMYNVSISMAMRKPFEPEVVKKAYRVAQIFEAIRRYPGAPPGAMLEAQATIAIGMIFLPKDVKTSNWCRRTYARIESAGYIYPSVLRNQMLEGWGMPPSDWWLPNDEDCPPIIRSIKNFIRERTTTPKDQVSEDLREMRGIFSTLTISDSPSSNSSSTPIESTTGAPSTIDETGIYTSTCPDQKYQYDRGFTGV